MRDQAIVLARKWRWRISVLMLSLALAGSYEGQPVLVATSIIRSDGGATGVATPTP